MTFNQNIKLCEASPGERIFDFAKAIVEYRQRVAVNVIGIFNDVYIYVDLETTEQDVIRKYFEAIK